MEIATSNQSGSELISLNAIRVETALSMFPVHRLARKGNIDIDIRENDSFGTKWIVSHDSKSGQPGPLAYKLDTLIVNRRIEEATKPVPRIIRLGSLHEICRELGKVGNKNRPCVRDALLQNASTFIRAKITYRQANGVKKNLEAAFTRYSVVFTGEKFPDGRSADSVYLILNDIYMDVINNAVTRPLDFDYLRELPPLPQRFYEILSYKMYATLKHDRPRAKVTYSDVCIYAPQTRYFEWEQARKQMAKVHAPHKKSGYILDVDFQQAVDSDGKPDWIMLYTPGPKARAQFRAFSRRGIPVALETHSEPECPANDLFPVGPPAPLSTDLISRGVSRFIADEMVAQYPAELIAAKIEVLDWQLSKKDKKVTTNPAGYLVDSIRKGYATPKGFVSKAEREKLDQAAKEARQREEEAARIKREELARERREREAIDAYLKALSPEKRDEIDRIAAAQVEADGIPGPLVRMGIDIKRRAHVRQLLQDAGKLPA